MRTTVQYHARDESSKLRERALIGCGMLLLMLFVSVQLAHGSGAPSSLASAPSTTAYHFSSHPMIAGTVVSVNDRQMVVNTDQGEQVTLAIDSRTIAPRDLAPGMVMRAEFLALEDCRFYAQRIMPVRAGMSLNRLQAYAATRDSRDALAHGSPGLGSYVTEYSMSAASVGEPPQTVGVHSPGTVMTATPASDDYRFSTRPMVSGRVVTVNDHRLLVVTDQGQRVGLVMDSHTMVPGEVTAGSMMRAEFTQMKDGRYYANRISRIGTSVVDREQAYAHTRDSDIEIARSPSDCGFVSVSSGNTVTSALERRDMGATTAPIVVQSVPQPVVERPETLPQTASDQPLILLFALSALGSAGLVAVARGQRSV